VNYLILPPNHTADDASIWRAAVRQGWNTVRGRNEPESYRFAVLPEDKLVYYGNTLHRDRIASILTLNARKLDPYWVLGVTQDQVFGRHVFPTTYESVMEAGGDVDLFFKCPHEKWFKPFVGRACQIPTGMMMPHDLLYVQDVINFIDEVRLWVKDGKIVSWSYYIKNGRAWKDGPNDEMGFPMEWSYLVQLCMDSRKLPRSVVIDVGRVECTDPRREWYVIEANEPWASGIYDSNPESCLEVIVANQNERVPS
jgi:hypothetical protein